MLPLDHVIFISALIAQTRSKSLKLFKTPFASVHDFGTLVLSRIVLLAPLLHFTRRALRATTHILRKQKDKLRSGETRRKGLEHHVPVHVVLRRHPGLCAIVLTRDGVSVPAICNGFHPFGVADGASCAASTCPFLCFCSEPLTSPQVTL